MKQRRRRFDRSQAGHTDWWRIRNWFRIAGRRRIFSWFIFVVVVVREQKEKAAPIAVVGEEAVVAARPSIVTRLPADAGQDLLPQVGSERDKSLKSGYACRTGKGKEIWGWIPGQVWSGPSAEAQQQRFEKVLSVLHISWLEIHAKIDACMLSPKTTYRAYFVFSLDGESKFEVQYAEITVELGSHTTDSFSLYKPHHSLRCWLWNMRQEWVPQYKSDGWMEIAIGEFFIDEEVEGEVQMTLMMAARAFIDGLFVVEGIDIRPVFK